MMDNGIVGAELVSDREIMDYYTDLFSKQAIQDTLKEWGEQFNPDVVLERTRMLQARPDSIAVFMQHDYRIVGSMAAVAVPSLYSRTMFASEIVVSALPIAPVRTCLVLHKEFLKWARYIGCEKAQVAYGPYTPESYIKLLTRLEYKRLGGLYARRI